VPLSREYLLHSIDCSSICIRSFRKERVTMSGGDGDDGVGKIRADCQHRASCTSLYKEGTPPCVTGRSCLWPPAVRIVAPSRTSLSAALAARVQLHNHQDNGRPTGGSTSSNFPAFMLPPSGKRRRW